MSLSDFHISSDYFIRPLTSSEAHLFYFLNVLLVPLLYSLLNIFLATENVIETHIFDVIFAYPSCLIFICFFLLVFLFHFSSWHLTFSHSLSLSVCLSLSTSILIVPLSFTLVNLWSYLLFTFSIFYIFFYSHLVKSVFS